MRHWVKLHLGTLAPYRGLFHVLVATLSVLEPGKASLDDPATWTPAHMLENRVGFLTPGCSLAVSQQMKDSSLSLFLLSVYFSASLINK